MTLLPRKENWWRIAMRQCAPPPPLCVASKTDRLLNNFRKSSDSTESHAIVLLSAGGITPLYSGAQTTKAVELRIRDDSSDVSGDLSRLPSNSGVYTGQ